jgi:hypothetical protein
MRPAFRKVVESSAEFDQLVKSCLNAVLAEAAQTIARNRLHTVNERYARWLLLVQDRVGRSGSGSRRSSCR